MTIKPSSNGFAAGFYECPHTSSDRRFDAILYTRHSATSPHTNLHIGIREIKMLKAGFLFSGSRAQVESK